MRRLIYTGRLHLPNGFHSGEGRGREASASEQPLRREADGSVAVAGTSLAGVLRADLGKLAREVLAADQQCRTTAKCRCVVCRLMGPRSDPVGRKQDREASLSASKLSVMGGAADSARIRVRDRVGIGRRTRTAAPKRKYDVEVAEPRGGEPLEVPFELRLDEPEDDEVVLLEAVLRRLGSGWLFLGGQSASGLGRAELAELARHELDLTDRTSLVSHLLGEEASAGAKTTELVAGEQRGWLESWELQPATDIEESDTGWAQIRVGLELDFPWGLLVNDPGEALAGGMDHSYLRLEDGQPVLPASALRGALRSRAEQIVRTLGGADAACQTNTDQACHERLQREIASRKKRAEPGDGEAEDLDESERHCAACRVFGSARWASPIRITDFYALPGHGGVGRPQEQVAIDRFTGGAAEGAKFDLETAAGVQVAGEIHLEIGPYRLEEWGLGLLALTLRDLLWGDVPLGFASGRGLNEYRARLTSVERFWIQPPAPFAGEGLAAEGAPGSRSWKAPEAGRPGDPSALAQAIGPEWQERLESWVERLEELLGQWEATPPVSGAETAEEDPT